MRTLKPYNVDLNYFNWDGICLLLKALALNDPNIVRTLLEIKTQDVNLKNISSSQNLGIIKILTKAGVDPSIFAMRDVVRQNCCTGTIF